jgi:hypothetical protein
MSIQCCPDEVLDMIFQLLPFQSPDKVPAVLLPTMLTCSRFCAIAKCHLIRVVCLQTAGRVNAFAAYLIQLIDTGAYGKALLPIEHMAVLGKYRIPRGRPRRNEDEAEKAAEHILPFVISTAAPSLRSLAILGFDSRVKSRVQPSVRFQKLQRLILLEQRTIDLDSEHEQDENSPQYCYPQLTSLYSHNGQVNDDVLGLHTLCELRLEMLDASFSFHPPSLPIPHVQTIIIDAPPYRRSILDGCIRYQQPQSEYDERIESYHTFVKANSTSPESSVVVAQDLRVRPEAVLDAWKDIVQGGSGCWKKGWEPTTE